MAIERGPKPKVVTVNLVGGDEGGADRAALVGVLAVGPL
jgi:hypothetical protein